MDKEDEKVQTIIDRITAGIKARFSKEKGDAVDSKLADAVELKLKDYKTSEGATISVNDDTQEIQGDTPTPDGEVTLEDGQVLVVKDNKVAEVKPAPEKTDAAAESAPADKTPEADNAPAEPTIADLQKQIGDLAKLIEALVKSDETKMEAVEAKLSATEAKIEEINKQPAVKTPGLHTAPEDFTKMSIAERAAHLFGSK